ncbi:MAG: hypothetical protein NZ521_08465, partial [Flammeovirgaceae bacterium]|nr:hypothetical protein [Flammeovirgaceae bacterium]MDW8288249.1 hypothetical protein [Flammeovirgaceae bacterium]
PKGTFPSGIYALKRNRTHQTLGFLALNYDKRESQLSYYHTTELKELLRDKKNVQLFQPNEEESFVKRYQEQNLQTNLWRWFIVFALLALLAETLLIRYWKTT